MNETLKTIAERYTCRDFSPEPLETAQIDALVNAALAAPSAMNLQPWHLVVVTDKKFIEEMDAATMDHVKNDPEWYERMKERGGNAFYNVPCMIFIGINETEWAPLDCGIVSQNIALAAHSLGLGSVICGMARIPLEGARGADFLARLKFPEGYSFGMSVGVGKVKSGKPPHELDKNKVSYISSV
ncbi:MAG: nitroreductase [Defluviitaleaceae bacterium]|nr:nitroreductase [Defluviitaleaceae bacterium]